MSAILELARAPLNTLVFAAILYLGFLIFRASQEWVDRRNRELEGEHKIKVYAAFFHGFALKALVHFDALYDELVEAEGPDRSATKAAGQAGGTVLAASGDAQDRMAASAEKLVAHLTKPAPPPGPKDPAEYDPPAVDNIFEEAELARAIPHIDAELAGLAYYFLQERKLFLESMPAFYAANDDKTSPAYRGVLVGLINSASELVVVTRAIGDAQTRKRLVEGAHPKLVLADLVNDHRAREAQVSDEMRAADHLVRLRRAGVEVKPVVWGATSGIRADEVGQAEIDADKLVMQTQSYDVATIAPRRIDRLHRSLLAVVAYFMLIGLSVALVPPLYEFLFGKEEAEPTCTSAWTQEKGLSVSCTHLGADIPPVIEGLSEDAAPTGRTPVLPSVGSPPTSARE